MFERCDIIGYELTILFEADGSWADAEFCLSGRRSKYA